ncbi:hypothetical protein HKX48_009333, partial [Thoreauomyces humboldtii]
HPHNVSDTEKEIDPPTGPTITSKSITGRKQRPHLLPRHDVYLLRETVSIFPFGERLKERARFWAKVVENANATLEQDVFDVKRARERITLLVGKMREQEMVSMRQSGTSEEYEERDILLTDLINMIDDIEVLKNGDKEKTEKDEADGEYLRNQAMVGLRDRSISRGRSRARKAEDLLGSSDEEDEQANRMSKSHGRKRGRDAELLDYLEREAEEKQRAKERQLELEAQRLALDERRLLEESRRITLDEGRLAQEVRPVRKYSSISGGDSMKKLDVTPPYKQVCKFVRSAAIM